MFSSGFAGSIFNAPAGQAVKSKLDLCECRTWLGLIVLNLLFLLCVVTVFHWFDHWLLLMITVTVMLVLDRGLFRQIDYSLLFTFAGFFIFIGNLTQFDFLNIIRDSFLEVRPVHIFLQLLSASLSAMSLLQCCWLRFLSSVKLCCLGSMSADWEL